MKLPAIIALLLVFCRLDAQIIINTQQLSIETYVNELLLGTGIEASNILFSGSNIQIAEFDNNNTRLSLFDGIVIVTGDATIVKTTGNGASGGPVNTRSNSTSAFFDPSLEPQLSALAGGGETFDVAVLEFDFVPIAETIQFRYVFASEEYHEYNCTEFNDVFAFWLSGPGFPEPVNLAKLPGTDIPVSINTVNNGTVGSEDGKIENCSPPGGALDNEIYFRNNVGGDFFELDGLTIPLVARASVIPCQKYHIKLAIADIADHNLDSAVFFEKKSFRSNGLIVQVFTENNDNVMLEGCTHATVVFTLPPEVDEDVTLGIELLGTAERDQDYTDNFPEEIFIPAGENNATFEIFSLHDDLRETGEEIRLIHEIPGCAKPDTIRIKIIDEGQLQVIPDTGRLTVGELTTIQLDAFFGTNPKGFFSWSPTTGLSDPSISSPVATISDTITYIVTYIDEGCIQSKAVPIVALPTFKIYIPNAFTPNGDNINDKFVFTHTMETTFKYEMNVYNRWGTLVYSHTGFNNSIDPGWDGTIHGDQGETGVYIYVMKIKFPDEESNFISGDLTLIR